jgi:hypothetical protein
MENLDKRLKMLTSKQVATESGGAIEATWGKFSSEY